MAIPESEIQELASTFKGVEQHEEGGFTYFLIPALQLPEGCTPAVVDVLLCPVPKDGYTSRLYFSAKIQSREGRNWTVNGERILDRNWWAFSWQSESGLRLVQMVAMHLRALK